MAGLNVEFHPEIARNIRELKIDPVKFRVMFEKIKEASADLPGLTYRIRGLPEQFRKLRFEDKRVILWLSSETVYVVRIFHRREGYSKQSLHRLLRLVKDFTGVKC